MNRGYFVLLVEVENTRSWMNENALRDFEDEIAAGHLSVHVVSAKYVKPTDRTSTQQRNGTSEPREPNIIARRLRTTALTATGLSGLLNEAADALDGLPEAYSALPPLPTFEEATPQGIADLIKRQADARSGPRE